MEWWHAAAGLLTVLVPLIVLYTAISIFIRDSRSYWKPSVSRDVFLQVTTNALYNIGDAVYHNGYHDIAAGIYRITRLAPDKHYPKAIQDVYGELIFPGVLSDCVGLQICGGINKKIQCPHHWHHGPERPAYDENHVHPEPPKQPSNLVAYTGNKCSMQPVQPIMTYQNTSSRWR